MDSVIGDWLAQSPRVADAGEDLACVDQWLNAELIDIGADLAEDDIARSLEDFTCQEFFNGSPAPFVGGDTEHAPLQQLSASSQPTSSGDDPASSCGGDGVCRDTSSTGMGHFTRAGAFRSFSTNDLQLLLEKQQQQANLLPPVAALSAPPYQYGGLISLAGAKAKTRPALESVPEGAPSPGGPLPAASAAMAVRTDSAILGGGGVRVSERGIEATSPLPAAPTGVEYLAGSAPQLCIGGRATAGPFSTAAPDSVVAAGEEVPAGATTTAAASSSSTQPAAPLLAAEAGGAALSGSGGVGGLRHIPSTGTLSALVNNTLSFQREAAEEATHHHQQQLQQPSPSLTQPQPVPHHEPRQAADGAAGPAGAATASPQASTAPPAEYGSGAAAAAAAAAATAAAASVFPQGAMSGVLAPQPFALPPPAGLYGMASHLYTSVPSYPPSAYALGLPPLPLPLPPANMLAGPPTGADDAAAAATAAGAVAPAAAAAPAGGGEAMAHSASSFGGAPRGLRKSQSALELSAWRSASLELPPDVIEGAAVTGQKLIGRLTPEERLQRILRYRHKRNMRNFNREIKYQCRKTLADSRPRVGGRFARNNDPNSVLPHQTKKALRARHVTGSPAAAAPEAQQQQQPGRDVKTASSSSTSVSVTSSSDNQAALCTSAGTAAAAVAGSGGALPYAANPAAGVAPLPQLAPAAAAAAADRRPAAAQHPQAASAFAAACGLAYSYGVQGMPYTVHGLLPGSLPPAAAAALQPPAGAPMSHRIDATALQHHYAVVKAAAQAAAQGVYAHLGMAPAPAPVLLHAPVLAGGTFGAATAATATTAGSVASAAAAAVKVEVSAADTGPTPMALGPAPGALPSRVNTPLFDALWTNRGAYPGVRAAAEGGCQPAPGALVAPAGGGATCMAVDG